MVSVERLEAAAATCKLLGVGGVLLEVGAVLPSPQMQSARYSRERR